MTERSKHPDRRIHRGALSVLHTALTNFIHSEKFLEEVNKFEEESCYAAFMTVTGTGVGFVVATNRAN